jgi:hypothetical protein
MIPITIIGWIHSIVLLNIKKSYEINVLKMSIALGMLFGIILLILLVIYPSLPTKWIDRLFIAGLPAFITCIVCGYVLGIRAAKARFG